MQGIWGNPGGCRVYRAILEDAGWMVDSGECRVVRDDSRECWVYVVGFWMVQSVWGDSEECKVHGEILERAKCMGNSGECWVYGVGFWRVQYICETPERNHRCCLGGYKCCQ